MKLLSEDAFEKGFKLLKRNKAVNIITSVYEPIKKPLLKISNKSINLPEKYENSKSKTNF